jgi:hypothetical protein
MLTLLLHAKTVWNDYFTGNITILDSKEYEKRQTPSDISVYVLNCLFRSITSPSGGGALCCTSVMYLLFKSTSFFSCTSSAQHGGAIFFSNSRGHCVLHEVCGYDCNSVYVYNSYGQFAHITVNNSALSKNYVNYSSIVRCVGEDLDSHLTLHLYGGKICCPSVNISLNKCQTYSGISCQPFGDPNSVTCLLSYSSFTDNNATKYSCFSLWTTDANFEIKSCNILRNTQVNLDIDGLFQTIGNVMIEDSCLLENKATRIFRQVSSSCIITLTNCTVDSTSNNRNLTVQNTVTKSFILALNHMSTRNCHSEYDSVGTLTPMTPFLSSSKNQKHYYTFGINFCQYQLRYLVSIISIFLFSFINLDASF